MILLVVAFLPNRYTRSTFNPPQDRESIMKTSQCLPVFLAVLSTTVEGWSCLPLSPVKKIRDISRKSFLVGAASGLVIGTTATAAGAAVVADRANVSNKLPYEPPPGSLTDKVVLITGGTAGLGLVRMPCFLISPMDTCFSLIMIRYSEYDLVFDFCVCSCQTGVRQALGSSRSNNRFDRSERCQG